MHLSHVLPCYSTLLTLLILIVATPFQLKKTKNIFNFLSINHNNKTKLHSARCESTRKQYSTRHFFNVELYPSMSISLNPISSATLINVISCSPGVYPWAASLDRIATANILFYSSLSDCISPIRMPFKCFLENNKNCKMCWEKTVDFVIDLEDQKKKYYLHFISFHRWNSFSFLHEKMLQFISQLPGELSIIVQVI